MQCVDLRLLSIGRPTCDACTGIKRLTQLVFSVSAVGSIYEC